MCSVAAYIRKVLCIVVTMQYLGGHARRGAKDHALGSRRSRNWSDPHGVCTQLQGDDGGVACGEYEGDCGGLLSGEAIGL